MQHSSTSHTQPTGVFDYATTIQVLIDRPTEEVWPCFFGKKKAIWTRSEYQTIAGEEGQLGAVFMHQYPVLGTNYFYFYEAIRLINQRELVLKITSKKSESQDVGDLIGYDVIRAEPKGQQTMVTLQQFVAFPTHLSKGELALETEKHDGFLADILQDLKGLVERGQ